MSSMKEFNTVFYPKYQNASVLLSKLPEIIENNDISKFNDLTFEGWQNFIQNALNCYVAAQKKLALNEKDNPLDLQECPVCNNLMSYNSYFKAYYCPNCGNFERQ